MPEKLIRDGKVAVLYSPGPGVGWSTWNGNSIAHVFSVRLALAVLGESEETPFEVAVSEFPDSYPGGVYQLKVEWVPEGAAFRIREYDGSESVELLREVNYFTA